jgi:hypothetical protein
MPQGAIKRYNPKTRKYETVNVDTTGSKKAIGTGTTEERKKLSQWVTQFDSVAAKPKRTNNDYAQIIRRDSNGTDITKYALNEALRQGVIDTTTHRQRLKKYTDILNEVSSRPVTVSGKPVTYLDPSTKKERTLMRSAFIQNGSYNFDRPIEDVLIDKTKRRNEMQSQVDSIKPVDEQALIGNYLGAAARGTYNRESIPKIARGAYKGVAAQAGDIMSWGTQRFRDTGLDIGAGETPEETMARRQTEDQQMRIARAAVANRFNDTSTNEGMAGTAGSVMGGFTGPADALEAGGYIAANTAPQVLGMMATGAAIPKAAAAIGLSPKVAQGIYATGLIGGQALEAITGNPVLNVLGNPLGAMRRSGGELGQESEENLALAQEMAPAAQGLMDVAGLTIGMAQFGAKSVISGAKNSKALLGTAQKEIAAAQRSATSMFPPAPTALNIGSRARMLEAVRPTGQMLSATAINAIANASPIIATEIARSGALGFAGVDKNKFQAPKATDVVSALAGGLYDYAPQRSLMGRFNKYQTELAVGAQARYDVDSQVRKMQQEAIKSSPLLNHLINTTGLSPDQALAYASQRHQEEFPGQRINDLNDLNQLRESREIEQGYMPTLNSNVLRSVNERTGAPKRLLGMEIDQPLKAQSGVGMHYDLLPFSSAFRKASATAGEKTALDALRQQTSTSEAVAAETPKSKKALPYPSMVIETDQGPKLAIYKPDLSGIYLTDDTSSPTSHTLTPESFEVTVSALPRENYAAGIARFNREDMARIDWAQPPMADGRVYQYTVRGFNRGGFTVTRTVRGSEGTGPTVSYTASREEIMRTAPPSKRDQLTKQLDDLAESFGVPGLQGSGRGINYSDTSFGDVDRKEFPSTVYVGKSTAEGSKGVVPTRLINNKGAFNTYQDPTGGIWRIPKEADTNQRTQVLEPVETRQRTYAGTGYAETPLIQAQQIGRPMVDVNYLDINLTGTQEGVRRVYINEKDRKWLRDKTNEYRQELADAKNEGGDLDKVDTKFNDEIHDYLKKISSTGKPDNEDVNYKYGYVGKFDDEKFDAHEGMPIRIGDVVRFASSVDENGNVSANSRLAHHFIDRGVVVGVDHNGVHVKIANQLPGIIGDEGGRTVLAHPETLVPETQPHLGYDQQGIMRLERVSDLDAPIPAKPVTPEPPKVEESLSPTETVDAMIDADGLAPDPAYRATLQEAQAKLSRNGTIAFVRDSVVEVSQTKQLEPQTAKDAVTNILNDDNVLPEHKERIVSAVLLLDIDGADLNSINKINHMIDAVTEWHAGSRPVNIQSDISATVHFSGTTLEKAVQRDVNTRALEAVHGWRSGQRLTTRVANYIDKLNSQGANITPAQATSIQTRAKQMAQVVTPLRSLLIGNGVTSQEIWSFASRLSQRDQMALAVRLQGINKSSENSVTVKQLKGQMQGLIPASQGKRTLTFDDFDAANGRFFAEVKAQAQRRQAEQAKISSADPKVSMSDLNDAIKNIKPDDPAMKEIFNNLSKQDMPETQFRQYFADMKFPNSEMTIGEAADRIKNGTFADYIETSNRVQAVVRRAGMQGSRLVVEDWSNILSPLIERLPTPEARESAKTYTESEMARAMNQGPENAALKAQELMTGLLNKVVDPTLDDAARVATAVKEVQQKTLAVNPVLKRIASLLATDAEAQQRMDSANEGRGGEVVEGAVERVQSVFDAIYDLNASQPLKPSIVSQDVFDAVNASVKEASTWLSEYGSTNIRNATWQLPLQSESGLFGHTPTGEAIDLTQKSAMGKNGMTLIFRDALDVQGASPEMKMLIDNMAASLADVYDLHAYSYAMRHVDYQMKSGTVDSANQHVMSLLSAVAKTATPERAAIIEGLINDVREGQPLAYKKDKSFGSVIKDAFTGAGDADYGSKLETFIYTHRAAQVQHEFYASNARVLVSSAKSSDFSPASNIGTSFASITAQRNKNRATERAQLNLLLHLNRTGDEARDTLSLGHEMFHGVFHTLPYKEKLDFAVNAVEWLHDSLGKTNSEVGKTLVKLKAAEQTFKAKYSELQDAVANATTDESLIAAQNALDDFEFRSFVDMHADTTDILYSNPIVNELVTTTMMTAAMNTPTIFSKNYDPSSSATAIMSRVGEFAKMAVVKMQSGSYQGPDWVTTKTADGKAVTGYQHRWQLPFSSFVASKNGRDYSTPLPLGSTISLLNTNSLVDGPTKLTLRKDIPVVGYAAGAKTSDPMTAQTSRIDLSGGRTRVPGASKISTATTLHVNKNVVELKSVPAELVGKHVADYQGKKYYALDSENGIPVLSVDGISVKDRIDGYAYLVTTDEKPTLKSKYMILKPETMPQDAVVSGRAAQWNSQLSSVLYNVWGKTSALASSMVGRVDVVSYNQLKQRAISTMSNVEGMPSKNVGNYDVGQDAYEGTIEHAAGVMSQLGAGAKIQEYADQALVSTYEWINRTIPEEQDAVRERIDRGLDSARRSLFGLTSQDIRQRPQINYDPIQTSRFLVSDDGNLKGHPLMFYTARTGAARSEGLVVRDVAADLMDYFNGFDESNEVADKVANALLKSQDAAAFQSEMTKQGLDEDQVKKVVSILEQNAGVSTTGVAFSNDTVVGLLRDFITGYSNWTDGPKQRTVSDFNSTLQGLVDGEMVPHIVNQRALIANAARAYAQMRGMPVGQVLENMGTNLHGEEYAGVSAVAHMMSLDLNNRSAAMKSYNDYSIHDVIWVNGSKDPVVILKEFGKANRYSADLREKASADSNGILYLAVDQAENTVRIATPKTNPVTGETTYVLGKNVHDGKAGSEAIARHFDLPTSKGTSASTGEMLFRGDELPDGGYGRKQQQVYDNVNDTNVYVNRSNEEVASPGLKLRLAGLMSGGQKSYAGGQLLTIINMLQSSKKVGQSQVVTVPLPHSWGADMYDPTGPYSGEFKFANFDQVLDAIESDPNGEMYNVLPRHLKVTYEGKGKFTITDMGLVGNEESPMRRSLGNFVDVAAGRGNRRIAPVEVYVARRLLAEQDIIAGIAPTPEEVADGIDPRQSSVFKQVETPTGKNPLSGDPGQWNRRSLFSQGYDPLALADDVQSPLAKSPVAEAENAVVDEVNVVLDESLKPDQVEFDVDSSGVYQARGGANMAGVHAGLDFVANAFNELNGTARLLILGGDMGVAFNQSWMLANPAVMIEHMADPNNRSFGPAMAMRAIGAALPNTPALMGDAFHNSKIPVSAWGDNYVHVMMEKVLAKTPGLTLDMLESYGLNLEYLRWHKEWKEGLLNNPDIQREDVPLNYRLRDYYGDSKVVQKVMPHLAPLERANVFYKDLAALIDFQRVWQQTQEAVPPSDKRDASGNTQVAGDSTSRPYYRENLRRQYAEAINLLNGNQSGQYSDVEGLARAQKAVANMFISSRYARSRVLLNPVLGLTVFGLKSGANKISRMAIGKDVANTTLERQVYGLGSEGFDWRVRKHIIKRVLGAYMSNAGLKLATSTPLIVPAFMSLFSSDEEERAEGFKVIMDNFAFNNGFLQISTPWGKKYQMTMPGATGRTLRQTENIARRVFTKDTGAWQDVPEWTFKQFVLNQLSPMMQTMKMAAFGKTFDGEDAFASNESYMLWRQKMIETLPDGSLRKTLMEMAPSELSNFIVNSVFNVSARDALKDIDMKLHKRLVFDEEATLSDDDVQFDLMKSALNFSGAGATEYDEDYEAWLKVYQDGAPRYKSMKEERDNAQYKNMWQEFNGKDFGASLDTFVRGRRE